MGQYSIKDIEKLTGVKAHTIRIWEQRYGFITPHRTDTNIRFYDDEHLKMLLNVSLLLRNGKKISHLSKMSLDEMSNELKVLMKGANERERFFEIQIDSLIIAMIELDEDKFEKIISNGTLRYGFETIMMSVLIPFLHKVGLLWSTGEINVAQEHFISNLIRRKLLVAIDAQTVNYNSNKKFLLFLPEDELHEIGLLFAKYLIKSRGHKVIYLGQSVPIADVIKLKEYYTADYLLTYFTAGYSAARIQNYLTELSASFRDQKILICGPMIQYYKIKPDDNVEALVQITDLTDFLDGLKVPQN